MSKKELDEAVFKMERPTKPGFKTELPPEQKGTALCFDISGGLVADETRCAAKRVEGVRGPRYFVKFCTEGPDKGHVLNPYSVYFREGDDVRMEQRRGKLRYEFKLVSETAFHNYIRFLQTKLYAFCQNAEREILNGS